MHDEGKSISNPNQGYCSGEQNRMDLKKEAIELAPLLRNQTFRVEWLDMLRFSHLSRLINSLKQHQSRMTVLLSDMLAYTSSGYAEYHALEHPCTVEI